MLKRLVYGLLLICASSALADTNRVTIRHDTDEKGVILDSKGQIIQRYRKNDLGTIEIYDEKGRLVDRVKETDGAYDLFQEDEEEED